MLRDWWQRLTGRCDWYLEGWDTFARHSYAIPGRYRTESAAVAAARKHLEVIERQQPTATSGGPAGIQDHIFVRGPNGYSRRISE